MEFEFRNLSEKGKQKNKVILGSLYSIRSNSSDIGWPKEPAVIRGS